MTWDGTERRNMDRDAVERDRLLTELHADMKYLVKTMDAHVLLDEKRFEEVRDKIEFHQKMVYGFIGIIGFVEVLLRFTK